MQLRHPWVALGSIVLCGVALAQTPAPSQEVSAEGRLFCSLRRMISFPFNGVVKEIRKDVGAPVRTNDVLARYELYHDMIQQINRRLATAREEDLAGQLSDVEKNITALQGSQAEMLQLRDLGMASTQRMDQTTRELQALTVRRDSLKRQQELEHQLLGDDQAYFRNLLGEDVSAGHVPTIVSLISPLDGYVVSIEPQVQVGAEVLQFAPAFHIGVLDPMILRVRLHEQEAVRVKKGDAASVRFDSLPGKEFQGTVSRVAWVPVQSELDEPAYYDVEVTIPNPDALLKEGYKGLVTFHVQP